MNINKEMYINSIQDKEKSIEMRKILDKIEIVLKQHCIESTDFLDPYERKLAISILNRFNEISYCEMGGLKECERQTIAIYPYYYNEEDIDSKISALRIEGNLDGLSHKDFLGSVLHLGIKRRKIGDILIHGKNIDIIIKKEICDFLLINLQRISNVKVKLHEISLEELKPGLINYKDISLIFSSLRLDVIISSSFNLSRQDSLNLIKSGNVKVNWEPIYRPSKELQIGDVISVKGYGRCIFNSIEGVTKKDRIRGTIRILI